MDRPTHWKYTLLIRKITFENELRLIGLSESGAQELTLRSPFDSIRNK